MVQRVSEKISEMTAATTMPTSSIVPFTHNGASFRATKSQLLNEYIADVSDTATGTANTTAIQACIDAARTAGGGKVRIPFVGTGVIPLTAPYRDTNGIYTGYVANDENRRANKALIIYDTANIEIFAEPGVVLDRSGDQVADTTYAEYSATLYVSKSSNIWIHDLHFLGYQEDDQLLDDVKNQTSGDHIQINSGSDNVLIEDCTMQDGTTGITVALNRTAAEAQIDPALDPVTNLTIRNVETRNNEHGMVLCDLDGFHVENFRAKVYTREDATTGVCQRPVYLHSCRNGRMFGLDISGAFKVGIYFRDYLPVTGVTIDGLNIHDMMTPAAILAARGSAIDTDSEGMGIRMQSSNCEDISISNFRITNVTSGVTLPGVGMQRVSLRKGYVDAVSQGICYLNTNDNGATLLDNPIDGLTLEDVEIHQLEDAVNYPSITPNAGLYVDSTAVDGGAATINASNVHTRNVRVYARNRNARLLNANGTTVDCDFTRSTGLAGARNFDFNYSGTRRLVNNLFGNNGAPNLAQDAPSAALVKGFASSDEPAQFRSFTVATLPSAALHSSRIVYVSNGYNGSPCLAISDGTSWWVMGSRQGLVASSVPTHTIAAGVITCTGAVDIAVDTEGAAASDDLDTINGTVAGQLVILRAVSSARTVVVKDSTGNIRLAGDFSLDNSDDRIVLRSDGTNLRELARSDIGA